MASPNRETPASDGDILKRRYDSLRIRDKVLHIHEREIFRLLTAKTVWFPAEADGPGQPGSIHHLEEYERKGFGNQSPYESEWWQRATHRHLFNAEDNLNREMERIISQKTSLEATRDRIRHALGALSRVFLRSLSIMDLPDEILLGIFRLVEDIDWELHAEICLHVDRKDIKNVRLVCRRFSNLSSELLVRRVRISPSEASLARLDAISRHPTISKGVCIVRVVLHLYNPALRDTVSFLTYHAEEAAGRLTPGNVHSLRKSGMTEQAVKQMINDAWEAVKMMERLPLPDVDRDGGRAGSSRLSNITAQEWRVSTTRKLRDCEDAELPKAGVH